jgi:colicin import membrane protein
MTTGAKTAPAPLSRDDLLPPARPAGMRRGLVLALIAHVLLVLALAIGVNWHSSEPAGTDAELWAAVPQIAAPPAAEPPPPPVPTATKPVPVPKAEPPPAPAKPLPDAQIAIDKEKQRKERQKKEEAQQQQELKERREREKKDQLKREQQQQQQQQQAEKAAEDKRKKETADQKKKQQQQEAERELAQAATQREAQIKRILNQASSTGSGSPGSTGTAEKTAGPSASYGGRIIGAIRPNIVFPNDISGNPAAEVEVRVGADGFILGRRLTKSSGVKEWDDAVLRAIDKTEKLPRDTDGRVAPQMLLVFKPKDLS